MCLNHRIAFITVLGVFLTVSTSSYGQSVTGSLYDFAAHKTDITNQHKADLNALAASITSGNRNCVRLVGHSAEWKNITQEQYCSRSIDRAKNAATYLTEQLERSNVTVKVLNEDRALLGNTNACTGSPLIEQARCPSSPGFDVMVVVGGRSISQPIRDNSIHSSSSSARANRAKNRRVSYRLGASHSAATSCTAPIGLEGMASSPDPSIRAREFQAMFTQLPTDRNAFIQEVVAMARTEVNLPALLTTFYGKNDEFGKPIKYKKIDEFAKINFFNHFHKMTRNIKAKEPGKPNWLKHVYTIAKEAGSERIDPYLALAITLREAGGKVYPTCQSCPKINSAEDAGFDNLFKIRRDLVDEQLIPASFKGVLEAPSADNKTNACPPSNFKRSACLPKQYLAAFAFANVGHVEIRLLNALGDIYFSDIENAKTRANRALSMYNAASPLTRRIWTQISLGGHPYNESFLKHFKLLNLPLDAIRDIPGSMENLTHLSRDQIDAKNELLRRANVKKAKKYYNAIKIGIVAEAFQRTYETPCETDRRNNPFLFGG